MKNSINNSINYNSASYADDIETMSVDDLITYRNSIQYELSERVKVLTQKKIVLLRELLVMINEELRLRELLDAIGDDK